MPRLPDSGRLRGLAAVLALVSIGASARGQSFTAVPNLVYGTYLDAGGATQNLLLDLYLPLAPAGPIPLVVWIHGGGWTGGSRFPAPAHATALCVRGYAVASLDYRLSGTALWPAQIHDCKGAVRWLRANAATWNLDPDRFGAWGSSAGGHLTALLGTTGGVASVTIGSTTVDLEGSTGGNLGVSSRVQAVCDWFGPTDFLAMRDFPTFDHEAAGSPESRLLGAPIQTVPALAATADAATFASPDDPPFLILHGTVDTAVPFNQSELLLRALDRGAGVDARLMPIAGNGHGGPGFTTPASQAAIEAHFDRLLLAAPAARVLVAASDAAAAEAGADPAAFTLTRSGPTAAPLVVRLAWSGTAARGADVAPLPLLAVIPAGSASASIDVLPLQDLLVEGAETVVLTVAPGDEYRIDAASASATATLQDDEVAAGLPVVSVQAVDPAAAETPGNPASFLLSRSGPTASPLQVAYRLEGRAKNGIDYATLPGIAVIPAGAASTPVVVTPLDDVQIEPSETVVFVLDAAPHYVRGAARTAGAHVADNDLLPALPVVSLVVADPGAAEPGADGGALMVTRTLGTAQPLQVALTAGGTAATGIDISPLPAMVTIPAGAASLVIPVTILDDAVPEGRDSVVLSVQPRPNYQVASAGTVELRIGDDDAPAPPASLELRIEPLVIGRLATFTVARGGAGALFGVAFALESGFASLPPLGNALIDVTMPIVLPGGALDAAGAGSVHVQVPADPAIAALSLWFQAFSLDVTQNAGLLSPAAVRSILLP